MFSIIIPIYDEEKNIEFLINEIFFNLKKFKSFEIILVDDCSKDSSLQILNKFNSNNQIKIIRNIENKGQSYSIHKGVKEALFNTIITIDGDGQNNPSDIPSLIKSFDSENEIYLVGGIRIKRKDSFIKIISSKIANYIRSKILNDNCNDTGCSLKVFDKKIFLEFPYFDGMHRFLPALFSGYGYKTKFLNVDHRKRKYGISKYGTFKRLFVGIKDIIKVKKIIKNNILK